jgi:hypothetical protein
MGVEIRDSNKNMYKLVTVIEQGKPATGKTPHYRHRPTIV